MEFNPQEKAAVIVNGEVYPGTTIIIGDSSMQVKNTYQYCRFERIDGDVKANRNIAEKRHRYGVWFVGYCFRSPEHRIIP